MKGFYLAIIFLIALVSGFAFVFFTERPWWLAASFLVNAAFTFWAVKTKRVADVPAFFVLGFHLLMTVGVILTIAYDGR